MLVTNLTNKFGKVAGWNNVSVVIFGRVLEGITALSYDDSMEKENIYGAGAMPVGRGEGNYQAKCSITLLKEEVDALLLSLGSGGNLVDIPPFDIPVVYTRKNGLVTQDIIRNCEFKGNGVDVKQGDTSIASSHELVVSHIDWNVAI